MEPDTSSEVITHIEIQKEIDTIHVIIDIEFPKLLKKKGSNQRIRERSPKVS
jgi:small subunit ribosomal protein S3